MSLIENSIENWNWYKFSIEVGKNRVIERKNREHDFIKCPFCLSTEWFIKSTTIRCCSCKREFDKEYIKNKNVTSINMNLKFLKDLYNAGVSEDKLGISNVR